MSYYNHNHPPPDDDNQKPEFDFDLRSFGLGDQIPPKLISLAVKAYYEAKISQATYQEIQGKLLPTRLVLTEIQKVTTKLREAFKNLPDRLSSRLAMESDESVVNRLIRDDLRDIWKLIDEMDDEGSLKSRVSEQRQVNPVVVGGKISKNYRGKDELHDLHDSEARS